MVDPKSQTIDPDAPNVKKVIKLLLEHHIVLDDTLALMEIILHPLDHPISAFEPGILKVAPELKEGLETMGVPPAEGGAVRRHIPRHGGDGARTASGRCADRRRNRPGGAGIQPGPRNRTLRAGRLYADGSDSGGDACPGARDGNGERLRDD